MLDMPCRHAVLAFLLTFLGLQLSNRPCRKEVMVVRNFEIGETRNLGGAR